MAENAWFFEKNGKKGLNRDEAEESFTA